MLAFGIDCQPYEFRQEYDPNHPTLARPVAGNWTSIIMQYTLGDPVVDYVVNSGIDIGGLLPAAYVASQSAYPLNIADGTPLLLAFFMLAIRKAGTLHDMWPYLPIFDRNTRRLRLFKATGGAFTGTPAVLTGTVAAPKINTTTDAVPDEVLSIKSGALSTVSGQDNVVGVQAPALTMNSYTPAGTMGGSSMTEVDPTVDLVAGDMIDGLGLWKVV